MSGRISYGSMEWIGARWERVPRETSVSRIGQGSSIDRLSQEDYIKMRLTYYPKGMIATTGPLDWTVAIGAMYRNEGLVSYYEGPPVLPPVITTQTEITSDATIATADAANIRACQLWSTVGSSSGALLYIGVLNFLLRQTSTSDPTLLIIKTFTNNITAIGEAPVNGTSSIIVCTDGTTDDICYSTDAGANFAELVTLSSGDYVGSVVYYPTVGGRPFIEFIGKIGGVSGIWFARTDQAPVLTVSPVVLNRDRDVEGTIAAVTASAIYPTLLNVALGSNASIANPTSYQADDGTDLTISWTDTGAAPFSSFAPRFSGFTVPSGAARNARISLLLIEMGANEDNADDNIILQTVQVVIRGTDIGAAYNLSNNSAEIATSSTTYSVDVAALGLTIEDILYLSLRFAFTTTAASGAAALDIDFVRITPTYIVPGDLQGFEVGGYGIGRTRFDETKGHYVAPDGPDQAGLSKRRKIYEIAHSWDNNGDRPVVDISLLDMGTGSVDGAVAHNGGVAAIMSGVYTNRGTALRLIGRDGFLRDLAFPNVHGSTAIRLVNIWSHGLYLICEVINADNSDRQLWSWRDNVWQIAGALQSKSATAITTRPMSITTGAIDYTQQQIYSVFPSTTHIGVARQFLPDLNLDPRITNTTQVKQMAWSGGTESAPLYLYTHEMNLSPEEAFKALVKVEAQMRRVSADASTYGRVVVDYSVDGGSNWVNVNTFSAGLDSTSGIKKLPSGGAEFHTIQFRIGLWHAAASAKSPDAGPILFTTVAEWGLGDDIVIAVNFKETFGANKSYPDFQSFLIAMEALKDPLQGGNPVQALVVNALKESASATTQGVPAQFITWRWIHKNSAAWPVGQLGQADDYADEDGLILVLVFKNLKESSVQSA